MKSASRSRETTDELLLPSYFPPISIRYFYRIFKRAHFSSSPPPHFLLSVCGELWTEISKEKKKKKKRKIFGKKKEKEKDERIYSLDRSVILNHPVHFIAKRVETTLEESVAQMSLKYGKDYAFPRKALFTTTGLCHGYPIKIAAD